MSPLPATSMRSIAVLAVTLGLCLGLSACGTNDDTSPTPSPAATVTLRNAFEEAEYPVNPGRVVATASAVDNLLALGVTPTAVVMTAQDEGAPWREGKLDGVERITVAAYGDLDLEKIAVAKPDVIIGDIYWIDSRSEYDQLSELAPTLNGPSQDPMKATWKERLTQLGELYGDERRAQRVLEEDADLFEQVTQDLPGLRGKTGWIGRDHGNGVLGTSPDPAEASNSFLGDLSMALPDTILGQEPNAAGGAFVVGPEDYDLFSADFSVIYAAEGIKELERRPTFANLPQVRAKTMVDGDYATVIGLAQPSSLVRSWALGTLRPILEKVAGL